MAGTPEGNPGEEHPASRKAPARTHAAPAPPQPPRGWRAQLRHAFAVEKPGPVEPTPEERAALEPLLREVRKRGLVGPAVLFLESVAPLNNVGAQALHFMQPIATAVLDPVRYATLAKYLERRGSVAWVVGELQRDTQAGA